MKNRHHWEHSSSSSCRIAVAVAKDKGSEHALRWTLENLLPRGQTVTLLHVVHPPSHPNMDGISREETEKHIEDFYHPYRCYCSRKEVSCETITLENQDTAQAINDYVAYHRIPILVLGASKNNLFRILKNDLSSEISKGAPFFCSVYIIGKGKVVGSRPALGSLPPGSTPPERTQSAPQNHPHNPMDLMPGRATENKFHDEVSDADISFASSGRLSTDSSFFAFYDNLGSKPRSQSSENLNPRLSYSEPFGSERNSIDFDSLDDPSAMQPGNEKASQPFQSIEEAEEKLRRLELQMKQTMEMYHKACKEALTAKQKLRELQLVRKADEKRFEDAMKIRDEALERAEKEREKGSKAVEIARAASKKAEIEAKKRIFAEMKACKEAKDKKLILNSMGNSHLVLKYRSLVHILVVLFIFQLVFF